jgi:hypothetical protein
MLSAISWPQQRGWRLAMARRVMRENGITGVFVYGIEQSLQAQLELMVRSGQNDTDVIRSHLVSSVSGISWS